MPKIAQVNQFLDQIAPRRLAEEWDNVGLLIGDPSLPAERILTCLTVTPETVSESIEAGVDLIVAHHPLPFRPIKRITTESVATKMVWDLIRAGISVYSPHTGFDSAAQGINQKLAARFQLQDIRPIRVFSDDNAQLGAGRIGKRPQSQDLETFVNQIKDDFGLSTVQVVGQPKSVVRKIAIACGSGGSFLSAAVKAGCDTFVTGETNFHTALEAKANQVSLVLLGHYASERFAVELLATELQQQFLDATVWASRQEVDPLGWL